jgi:hypothetical protein
VENVFSGNACFGAKCIQLLTQLLFRHLSSFCVISDHQWNDMQRVRELLFEGRGGRRACGRDCVTSSMHVVMLQQEEEEVRRRGSIEAN